MTSLRIGLIGLGLQGGRLADAAAHVKGITLTRAIGRSKKRAEEFGQKKNIQVSTSFSSLEGVDGVLIASPNHLHAHDVLAAIKYKKPFLIEKPLARTTAEARKIIRAAGKVKGFVDFQLRMHPSVQKAKADVAKGVIGDLCYAEFVWAIGGLAGKAPPLPPHMRWREDPKESGGGALPTRGSHLFDLVRFITGKEVASVLAQSDATDTKVDRTALGILTFTDGVPVYVMTSKVIPNADNRIVLYGTKGVIEIRDIFAHVPAALYEKTIACFRDELKGKKTVLATLTDGLASVAITEAFQKSARSGKRVIISRA